MIKRIEIFVKGRVQGVWFRAETLKEARKLGVKGYVENLLDGRVHVVAEGDEESLKKLIDFCRQGPPLAKVVGLDVKWNEPENEFTEFTIR